MAQSDAYIEIADISKHFGRVKAVDHVDFSIARGEFFSLLGASGCGKTTLLRLIAGFESPTSGEILIDGAAMSHVPPHKRPTNMVFQSYAIFPHLNVRENLRYGLRYEKIEKAETDSRIDEALAMVQLSGYGDRKSNELSGGQRQRVALARALIKRPKVLLLDEPLGALDKKLREEMQLELRALQKSLGITFVFVTHDQEEALTLSDRVAVMANGRTLQIASPKDLYNKPVSVEVADFIGQMNFFPAKVRDLENGNAVLDTEGLGTVAVSTHKDFVQKGQEIIVAIRPEQLMLMPSSSANGTGVNGTLKTAAYLGDRSHMYVTVAGREKALAVSAQEGNEGNGAFDRDDDVWLSWSNDAIVLLPKT